MTKTAAEGGGGWIDTSAIDVDNEMLMITTTITGKMW
jgi:hypothetical protein